ncbi:hypothetical protein [Streptomyces sp. WAC06614]|uniref:hypothetical protein n=1 Tax=Streptomyces sp. WAC06614 TaxID=2487416 RepID=UPI000F76E1A0|nr:hypothetical protein [Streptomyces sp. WAC06614]RSS79413.1 hypothetical protein EF918_17470 [Streptomyces sp. WAC06614]
MLALLLTGDIPAEGPAQESDLSPLASTSDEGIITSGGLMRLRRMFTKPPAQRGGHPYDGAGVVGPAPGHR